MCSEQEKSLMGPKKMNIIILSSSDFHSPQCYGERNFGEECYYGEWKLEDDIKGKGLPAAGGSGMQSHNVSPET